MESEKNMGSGTLIENSESQRSSDLWGFLKAITFRGGVPIFLGALVGIEILSIALKASTCAVFDGNVHVWETDDSELVWSDWGTCLFFLLFFIFQTKGHSTNYSSVYKHKDGKKFLVAQCASLLFTTFGIFTLFKYLFDIANFNFGRPLLTQSGQECHVLQLSTLFSNIVSLGGYLAVMFTFEKCWDIRDPFYQSSFDTKDTTSGDHQDLASHVHASLKMIEDCQHEIFVDSKSSNTSQFTCWKTRMSSTYGSLQESRGVASEMIHQLIKAVIRNYLCQEDYPMTAAAKQQISCALSLLSFSLKNNLIGGDSVFSFDSNYSDRKTPSGSLKNDLRRSSVYSFDSNHSDGNFPMTYQAVSLNN